MGWYDEQDVFAVNFSICMRPLSVRCARTAASAAPHSFEMLLTYPNQCEYTIKFGPQQHHLSTQLFKLSGPNLSDMRRVDNMTHASMQAQRYLDPHMEHLGEQTCRNDDRRHAGLMTAHMQHGCSKER